VSALATIGVYGFDAASFIAALRRADVRLVVDVRQRRGVRGAEYAWANAARLERALAEAGIAYLHARELAPTTDLRRLQYAEDARRGVGKRSRTELAPAYVERYTREVLARADLDRLAARVPADGAAALMCVERDAAACHRSLVAARLAAAHGLAVRHLEP
jgi:uncharacterized protein (DUF488 family)